MSKRYFLVLAVVLAGAGRVEAQCTSTIFNNWQAFSGSGGKGVINVEIPAGCGWTAGSGASWIVITSGATGSGNGTVTFTVAPNPTASLRGAYVFVAGRSAIVSQLPPIPSATFSDVNPALSAVAVHGGLAWGDYDGDGDLDLLLTGEINSTPNIGRRVSKVYRNDGGGVFTDIGGGLVGVTEGAVAWGDYDGDGDLDLVLTGRGDASVAFDQAARIYRNDGNGVFTDIAAPLALVRHSAVAWGDYDNDGDLDLLLTGEKGDNTDVAKIYRNDDGVFTDIGAALSPSSLGGAAWGDYDNDGDLDIALTGYGSGTKVYRNDGGGAFTDIAAGLPGVLQGASVAWGDYDNDGDLDLVLEGAAIAAKVYRNDGGGVFTPLADLAPVGEIWNGTVAWGDNDNDGDLDLLVTGGDNGSLARTRIYRNDGGGTFVNVASGLLPAHQSHAAWGDSNNDGKLDVAVSGHVQWSFLGADGDIATVFRNDVGSPNLAPSAPTNLQSVMAGPQATLSWAASADAQTPAAGLTYNLRVGTTPGASDVMPPHSDAGTGQRRLAELGNVNHGTTAWLRLPPGTYYWSVQAVDTAFAGSPFAAERSFAIAPPALAIGDVVVAEGSAGSSTAFFTVSLSYPPVQTVTVDFADAPGTATAGTDYVGAAGTLTFAAGETAKVIAVSIQGDTAVEAAETFTMTLSSPSNATLSRAQGTGTIANDDGASGGPQVSIDDRSVLEGSAVNAAFRVVLSVPTGQTVTVAYSTADGTAVAPADYANTSGVVTFTPGRTQQTIIVPIVTDSASEGTETFYVNLSGASGAAILDGQATGTIGDPPASMRVPMYRTYNASTDYHFFTTNEAAKNFAVNVLGFRDESTPPPFYVLNTYQPGSVPLFRMYNPNLGRHFYTAKTESRDFLISIGAVYENEEGFIYSTPTTDTTELFLLYNTNSGTHLFTADAAQKDGILSTFPGIWVQHTSVGYVFTSP